MRQEASSRRAEVETKEITQIKVTGNLEEESKEGSLSKKKVAVTKEGSLSGLKTSFLPSQFLKLTFLKN